MPGGMPMHGGMPMPGGMPQEKREVEVGPIWNNDDGQAKGKEYERNNPGWKFTGQWRTTIPGEMSVIEVVREQTYPQYPPQPYPMP